MKRPFPKGLVFLLPAILVVTLVFGLRTSPNPSSPAPHRLPAFATQSSTLPGFPERTSSFGRVTRAAFLEKALYQDHVPLPQIARKLRSLESQRLAMVEETARQLGLLLEQSL